MKQKTSTLLLSISLILFGFKSDRSEQTFIRENFEYAATQLKGLLHQITPMNMRFPRSTDSSGKLTTTNMYDWTPGFFPGSLWYIAEYLKDPSLQQEALRITGTLEPLKNFTQHHDLGFMMYCSYGNAYRLTHAPAYKEILVQAARSLSTRFNPTVGCIKSWNAFKSWHGDKTYYYPVIIDNMMNLELLYFASKVSGDTSFRYIATTHALTTLKNQIRKDYSSFHVVCYDTLTGKVLTRETAQGYADNSTWARGQAWSLYGFTLSYRETKDPRFLKAAQGMADWILNSKNLPADKIPYWDFNVGEPGYTPGKNSKVNRVQHKPRDVSAAAITASALLELSTYTDKKGKNYFDAAVQMLHALAGPAYKAPLNTNGNFLLKHSVGSIPHGFEIDVPLVYADYYFLEGLKRYDQLLKKESLFPETN